MLGLDNLLHHSTARRVVNCVPFKTMGFWVGGLDVGEKKGDTLITYCVWFGGVLQSGHALEVTPAAREIFSLYNGTFFCEFSLNRKRKSNLYFCRVKVCTQKQCRNSQYIPKMFKIPSTSPRCSKFPIHPQDVHNSLANQSEGNSWSFFLPLNFGWYFFYDKNVFLFICVVRTLCSS